MNSEQNNFVAKVPILNLSGGHEMLSEFTAEAHKHLLNAKNLLLILDTIPDDREATENLFKSFNSVSYLLPAPFLQRAYGGRCRAL